MSKIFALVVENKGGVGKSLIAQILSIALDQKGDGRVQLIDADVATKSFSSVTQARILDPNKIESVGAILNVIEDIASDVHSGAVMDTAGGDEEVIRSLLPWLTARAREKGVRLLVARPITISTRVQAGASRFAHDNRENWTLLVRNLGQGREKDDFAGWEASDARKFALANGAVEVELTNAGTRWGDEAAGFGLSLAEAALGRFDRLKDGERQFAESVFTRDIRSWLTVWLSRQVTVFREAIHGFEQRQEQFRRQEPAVQRAQAPVTVKEETL